MHTRQFAILAVSILVASLAACDSKKEEQAPVVKPKIAPRPQAVAPADPTASMAHAVVIGKSGAAVDLKYDVLNKPESGKPIEIEIALIPGVLMDSMTVNVTGMPGVVLTNADANFGKLAAGEPARHKFTALVDQPDVVYLTVNTTTYSVGISSSRSFAIPLIVSAPPAAEKKDEAPAQPAKSAAAPVDAERKSSR